MRRRTSSHESDFRYGTSVAMAASPRAGTSTTATWLTRIASRRHPPRQAVLAAAGVSQPALPRGVGGTLRTLSRCVSSCGAMPAHHPRRRDAPLDARRGRGNLPDCPRCDLHPLAPGSSICRHTGPPVAALGSPAGHSSGEIRCLPRSAPAPNRGRQLLKPPRHII